jgi:hypothetical protein
MNRHALPKIIIGWVIMHYPRPATLGIVMHYPGQNIQLLTGYALPKQHWVYKVVMHNPTLGFELDIVYAFIQG